MQNNKYNIVAICQINNELRKGNLERFVKYILPNVNALVAYDDASSDGSFEYISKYTNHVIKGTKNNFVAEWQIKKQLVDKALELNPDFILLIDADEVITDNDGSRLQQLGQWVIDNNLDGALIHDINLWRSRSWKRTDSDFDDAYFPRFWYVKNGILTYSTREASLHRSPAPDEVRKCKVTSIISFLHFGFADEYNIVSKYVSYAKRGQRGENLSRMINEVNLLKTEKVDKVIYPTGLWIDDEKPIPLSGQKWYQIIEDRKSEILKPRISIVCLIYQSTTWLKFVYDQVIKYTDLSDKEFFFVANDATRDVKDFLRENYIPHYLFENSESQKKEWYINNVYRAWNFGAQKAQGEYVLFINSDMAFSEGWVENLVKHTKDNNCISSRLIESGNLPTGGLCIEKNFGRHLDEYKEEEFCKHIKNISEDKIVLGGAYMPILIKKQHFLEVGGYPEGNVIPNSDIFKPIIAEKGQQITSGDIILMEKLKTIGVEHYTAFNSISYHFQEGEMRDIATHSKTTADVRVLIINNNLKGKMGEKTLWHYLLTGLPNTAGIDYATVGATESNFKDLARIYIKEYYPNVELIIQNASFIDVIVPEVLTVTFLQDDLRQMKRLSPQQEENLQLAHVNVSNSTFTAGSYLEYFSEIIPIGINAELFKPADKKTTRLKHKLPADKRIGIFVGDLSETKGWSQIYPLIKARSEIHWIIVSKSEESLVEPNVSLFNKISQETLAELYQSADFFIIGSKVETLCLAAVEACACDIPVIMRDIGIFAGWSNTTKNKCGIFGEDFESALQEIDSQQFSPRQTILEQGLTLQHTVEEWWTLISQLLLRYSADRKFQIINTGGITYKIKRKIKAVFNKTFIIVLARRTLHPKGYEALLALWRWIKKLKP